MPDNVLERLGRSKYQVFLDLTQDTTFTDSVWTRVKKSTQATMTANEQTEDYDYIDNDDTQTEIVGNQIAIALDQANIDGDDVYEFLEEMMVNFPTGESAKVPFLYLMGGSDKLAVRGIASISDKELSPTDRTISYNLNVLEKESGTYTISDGVPEFTPSTALKATPSSISIVKGEDGTVVISGGTGTYTVSTETANITATLGLDGKTVTIETNLSSASSDTLTISDGEDEITVAITCTEPSNEEEGE